MKLNISWAGCLIAKMDASSGAMSGHGQLVAPPSRMEHVGCRTWCPGLIVIVVHRFTFQNSFGVSMPVIRDAAVCFQLKIPSPTRRVNAIDCKKSSAVVDAG